MYFFLFLAGQKRADWRIVGAFLKTIYCKNPLCDLVCDPYDTWVSWVYISNAGLETFLWIEGLLLFSISNRFIFMNFYNFLKSHLESSSKPANKTRKLLRHLIAEYKILERNASEWPKNSANPNALAKNRTKPTIYTQHNTEHNITNVT